MIFKVYTSANDEFTRIAALILAKIWLTGTLTSVKRLSTGSAHYGIPEDRKFASASAQKKLKEKYKMNNEMCVNSSMELFTIILTILLSRR